MKKLAILLFFLGFALISNAQPSNDNICNAIPLTNANCATAGGFPTNYSNASATNVGEPASPSCWGSTANNTVWFSFVATSTSQMVTTNINLAGGGVLGETQIAIYSSSNNTCTGTLTQVACQDDICNCMGPANNQLAEVTATGLVPGNTYFIRVDGDGNNTGTFRICTQAAPANDGCANATSMALNTNYNFSNVGASPYTNNNTGDLEFSCGSTENMVFYSFTPTITGTYNLIQGAQTCNSASGTQLIVYNAGYNCGNIPTYPAAANPSAEMVCSAASSGPRNISLNLVAGQTYYIVLDGYAGAECTSTFSITMPVLPIELVSFDGKVLNGKNELKWVTATETNNDYFEILVSHDAVIFERVGTISGAGNSSTHQYYVYYDTNAKPTLNYYKIKQVDFNGEFSFSSIIVLDNTINPNKKVVKVVDLMGYEVNQSYQGPRIIIYNDGTVLKTF